MVSIDREINPIHFLSAANRESHGFVVDRDRFRASKLADSRRRSGREHRSENDRGYVAASM